MKGKVYTKKGKKVVRWTNGIKLLTGEPYEWEAVVINQPIDCNEGDEVEFKMTQNFRVEIINNDKYKFENED